MSKDNDPDKNQLTIILFDTKPSIECRLASCRLQSFSEETCLVASFKGTIENSHDYQGGYSYMHAMIGSGFAACNPATLILDFRELEYESGDQMSKILDQRLITKVIISDLNREALTRLIANVHFLDPKAELFDSLSDALNACDSAYGRFLRAGLKKTMASDF
jgi:hypothetical protein